MGYDIEFGHRELYFTYNFSRYSDICLEHFDDGCNNECVKTHIWYYIDDCDRHQGDIAAEKIQNALDLLNSHGIYESDIDKSDQSWRWGNPDNLREIMRVLTYHLRTFKEIALSEPESIFTCDYPNDNEITYNNNYFPAGVKSARSVSDNGEEL